MDSYDSNQILILLHFSRSTRFAILCTAQIAKFQKKTRHNFGGFEKLFRIIHSKFRIFQIERAIFRQNFDEILSEFHEHAPNVKNFQFLEKNTILRKIRENSGNVQIIQKIIQFIQSSP